jgi:hypothetical protein
VSKRKIGEKELLQILQKSNKQLYELIMKQMEAEKQGTDTQAIEAEKHSEVGQAVIVMKMLQYVRGEIELDEIE